MDAYILALVSALAGIVGGWLALSKRIKPDLAVGFTAGTLIGLAAFTLLPEIFELSATAELDILWPMTALVAGFLLIHVIEKLVVVHHSHEGKYQPHTHPFVGLATAVVLIGHSFLDGVSIAIAFQLGSALGLAVAIAVIGHRFADGFNIANLVVRSGGHKSRAIKLVAAGTVAPLAGVLVAGTISIPVQALLLYLGFFTGLILYIGASDILPQAHSKSTGRASLAVTFAGVVFMYFVSQLA